MRSKKKLGPAYRAGSPSDVEIKLKVTEKEAEKIREDASPFPSIMAYLRSKLL
jgi:hypothetical protein